MWTLWENCSYECDNNLNGRSKKLGNLLPSSSRDAINTPVVGNKDMHRHFDPATGTIYCENHKTYDKKSIETARDFMEAKAKSYAVQLPTVKTMGL